MKKTFHIPDELRTFMREVASKLDVDLGSGDARTALLGPDALECECARGGRVEGSDVFRFSYFARDGHGRWELSLREQQIRDIAAGHLSEFDADELDPDTRTARGEPLLVWGEYAEDALRIRSPNELAIALDALHSIGMNFTCALRLWSASDEQVVVVLNGHDCALYVVRGTTDYGTSVGDPTRNDAFELVDHDAGELVIPWSDCIPWRVARPALLRFAEQGDLGDGVILEGRIPSNLLVLGDFDRATELTSRRTPSADPALSSLPAKTPYGAWAERLLRGLVELGLIEIDTSILADITARVSLLLQQLGDEAQELPGHADKLAKEVSRLRGVGALFATGGDLQIALRRTQEPPTMPVEIPFT